MLGMSATFVVCALAYPGDHPAAISTLLGGQLFNIIRSITYHKPKPKSSVSTNANNFKPYDGLKFAVLPAESGDWKVIARYDYTF